MDGRMLANGAGNRERENKDFYPTPWEATQALINFCKENDIDLGLIWEPACGDGAMAHVFEANQYIVLSSDIVMGEEYDFLKMKKPQGVKSIITNPPFFLAEDFIRKATREADICAFLLKCQYWHSAKRYDLYQSCPPAFELDLTWRPDFLEKKRGSKGSPTMDVTWFLWIKGEHDTRARKLLKPKK